MSDYDEFGDWLRGDEPPLSEASSDLMSPFHPGEDDNQWEPSFREDVILSRREALLCCIEGIRQMMQPQEFDEIVAELRKPPQEP